MGNMWAEHEEVFPGVILIAAGIVLHRTGKVGTLALPAIGILLVAFAIFWGIRQSIQRQLGQS
jgi:hypothetical protein